MDMPKSALDHQEAGTHYKQMKIQPVEYIHGNGIGFIEGCVIKYVTRWKQKNGIEDLKKARHFLDLLIELETKKLEETALAKLRTLGNFINDPFPDHKSIRKEGAD